MPLPMRVSLGVSRLTTKKIASYNVEVLKKLRK
jgi:hypothetical protein